MLRNSGFLRGAVVIVSSLAWLAATNHCVLASGRLDSAIPALNKTARGDAAVAVSLCQGVARMSDDGKMPSGCPMHAKHRPTQKQNGCGDLPCCKNLQATPSGTAKPVASPSWVGRFSAFLTQALDVDDPPPAHLAFCSGTGPPLAESFSELVLQRSILAHAPPVFLS